MTASVSVVVFGMLEHGHIKRLLPIVSGLAHAGMTVRVFADCRFHDEVAAAGGRPLDLFRDRPLDRADASSVPIPCRYVSFAGHYADSIVAEVAALRPVLVVHDTFAVIGPVVAHHLGIPCVNVCVGHNHAPVPTLESFASDPRVAIAQDCWRAVRLLRERHGMPDASPFSYVTSLSRTLNLYCEPPAFLRPEERLPFEPLAFIGSLSESTLRRELGPSPFGVQAADKLRVYVSFGTVIWRYYEAVAKATLEAIAEAVSAMPSVAALVSLGRAELGTWSRSLACCKLVHAGRSIQEAKASALDVATQEPREKAEILRGHAHARAMSGVVVQSTAASLTGRMSATVRISKPPGWRMRCSIRSG